MSVLGTILTVFLSCAPHPPDTLRGMFWNLENFFDWRNDSTTVSDAEFSSKGARHWTRKRFDAKCNAIAKTILWAASQEGELPDFIGLAEVENAFVLRRLLQSNALRKLDYQYIHFESPDKRGIDVALLYRTSRLRLQHAKPNHLYDADSTVMATRDILSATFVTPSGGQLALLVNHHPSKFGGAAVSEPRRRIAVVRLRQLADSLRQAGFGNIVAMGDMNDGPDNPVYHLLDSALINLAAPLAQKGEGTIRYAGTWELIDVFFVSSEMEASAIMKILRIPFLTTRDGTFGGEKPLRTYSGPRYLGGVSDHCPIWLQFHINP